MLWAPVTLHVYKRRKAQQQRKASTPQRYCFGLPALTGSGVVHLPRANASQICFHFTNENLYVGSNDVELVRHVLW
jgi:hypothetical protein